MDAAAIGEAGLQGWRKKVGDSVAPPVAAHTPLTITQVRNAIGGAFLLLSIVYVLGAIRRILDQT